MNALPRRPLICLFLQLAGTFSLLSVNAHAYVGPVVRAHRCAQMECGHCGDPAQRARVFVLLGLRRRKCSRWNCA
jgi:hypothetical protein